MPDRPFELDPTGTVAKVRLIDVFVGAQFSFGAVGS